MSSLRLIGIACDEPRLMRLSDALREATFLCTINVGTPQSAPASLLEQDTDFAVPSTRVIDIACWTQASVCSEGAELQALAARICGDGSYISLVLDDVELPASVASAKVVRAILQAPAEDQQALAPLIEWLRGQVEVSEAQEPKAALADIQENSIKTLNTGKEIIAKVLGLRVKLKTVTAGMIVVVFTGAFGFFADLIGTQDTICSVPWINETCANRGWGNVPTKAEKREWEQAASSSDCSVFQGIHERGGHFANEAKRRIDSAKYSPGRDDDRFPLLVPYNEPPVNSESLARSELMSRAHAMASEMCTLHGQNFDGEAEPGRFEPKGDAQCETRGGGHACTIDGVAVCAFMKKNLVETCPRPEAQVRSP